MTEEIINSDGSRNWQANILLDNVKRLEQENKQMKSALEEIREFIKYCKEKWSFGCTPDCKYFNPCYIQKIHNIGIILQKINEVLQ